MDKHYFYAPIDWKVRTENWNRSDGKASSCAAACGWHGVGGGELSEGSVQKTVDRLRSCPRYYCSWG